MDELGSDRTLVINDEVSLAFSANLVLLNQMISNQLSQYRTKDRALIVLEDLPPELREKLNTVSDSTFRLMTLLLEMQHTNPIVSTVSSQIALAEVHMYDNMSIRKNSPFYRNLLWQLLDKQVLVVSLSRLSVSSQQSTGLTVDLSVDSDISSSPPSSVDENEDYTPIPVDPSVAVEDEHDHNGTDDLSTQSTNLNSPTRTLSTTSTSTSPNPPTTPTNSPITSPASQTTISPSQNHIYPDVFHYDTERNFNAAHCNPLSSYAEWYHPWQILGNSSYIMTKEKPDLNVVLPLSDEIVHFVRQMRNDNKINAPSSFRRSLKPENGNIVAWSLTTYNDLHGSNNDKLDTAVRHVSKMWFDLNLLVQWKSLSLAVIPELINMTQTLLMNHYISSSETDEIELALTMSNVGDCIFNGLINYVGNFIDTNFDQHILRTFSVCTQDYMHLLFDQIADPANVVWNYKMLAVISDERSDQLSTETAKEDRAEYVKCLISSSECNPEEFTQKLKLYVEDYISIAADQAMVDNRDLLQFKIQKIERLKLITVQIEHTLTSLADISTMHQYLAPLELQSIFHRKVEEIFAQMQLTTTELLKSLQFDMPRNKKLSKQAATLLKSCQKEIEQRLLGFYEIRNAFLFPVPIDYDQIRAHLEILKAYVLLDQKSAEKFVPASLLPILLKSAIQIQISMSNGNDLSPALVIFKDNLWQSGIALDDNLGLLHNVINGSEILPEVKLTSKKRIQFSLMSDSPEQQSTKKARDTSPVSLERPIITTIKTQEIKIQPISQIRNISSFNNEIADEEILQVSSQWIISRDHCPIFKANTLLISQIPQSWDQLRVVQHIDDMIQQRRMFWDKTSFITNKSWQIDPLGKVCSTIIHLTQEWNFAYGVSDSTDVKMRLKFWPADKNINLFIQPVIAQHYEYTTPTSDPRLPSPSPTNRTNPKGYVKQVTVVIFKGIPVKESSANAILKQVDERLSLLATENNLPLPTLEFMNKTHPLKPDNTSIHFYTDAAIKVTIPANPNSQKQLKELRRLINFTGPSKAELFKLHGWNLVMWDTPYSALTKFPESILAPKAMSKITNISHGIKIEAIIKAICDDPNLQTIDVPISDLYISDCQSLTLNSNQLYIIWSKVEVKLSETTIEKIVGRRQNKLNGSQISCNQPPGFGDMMNRNEAITKHFLRINNTQTGSINALTFNSPTILLNSNCHSSPPSSNTTTCSSPRTVSSPIVSTTVAELERKIALFQKENDDLNNDVVLHKRKIDDLSRTNSKQTVVVSEFEKLLNERKKAFQALFEINDETEALLKAALQDRFNLNSESR